MRGNARLVMSVLPSETLMSARRGLSYYLPTATLSFDYTGIQTEPENMREANKLIRCPTRADMAMVKMSIMLHK